MGLSKLFPGSAFQVVTKLYSFLDQAGSTDFIVVVLFAGDPKGLYEDYKIPLESLTR